MDMQHFGSLYPDPPKKSRIHGFGFNQPKPNILLSKHKSKLLTNMRVMKSKFQPKKSKKLRKSVEMKNLFVQIKSVNR